MQLDAELAELLETLMESLVQAEELAKKSEFRAAFRDAQALCSVLQRVGTLDGPEYERLARFIDDSLPWTEEVLQRWHSFQNRRRAALASAVR